MRLIVCGLMLVFLHCAEAAMQDNGMDLQTCRFKDGGVINQPLCEKIRVSEDRYRLKKETERAYKVNLINQEMVRQDEQKAKDEELKQFYIDRVARQNAEDEARKQREQIEHDKNEREEIAYEKKQTSLINAKKRVCGDDFASPKIGMTIERAQQCVGKFKLISQLNRADGVISMYRSGGMYLHVMSGRIVSWQR